MTAGITQATGPPLILMQSSIHKIKWILMSNYLYKFSIFLVDMLSYLHWWAFRFCPFQNKIVDFDTCNCMSKNKNSTKLWVSLKCSEVFKLFHFILCILEEIQNKNCCSKIYGGLTKSAVFVTWRVNGFSCICRGQITYFGSGMKYNRHYTWLQ